MVRRAHHERCRETNSPSLEESSIWWEVAFLEESSTWKEREGELRLELHPHLNPLLSRGESSTFKGEGTSIER